MPYSKSIDFKIFSVLILSGLVFSVLQAEAREINVEGKNYYLFLDGEGSVDLRNLLERKKARVQARANFVCNSELSPEGSWRAVGWEVKPAPLTFTRVKCEPQVTLSEALEIVSSQENPLKYSLQPAQKDCPSQRETRTRVTFAELPTAVEIKRAKIAMMKDKGRVWSTEVKETGSSFENLDYIMTHDRPRSSQGFAHISHHQHMPYSEAGKGEMLRVREAAKELAALEDEYGQLLSRAENDSSSESKREQILNDLKAWVKKYNHHSEKMNRFNRAEYEVKSIKKSREIENFKEIFAEAEARVAQSPTLKDHTPFVDRLKLSAKAGWKGTASYLKSWLWPQKKIRPILKKPEESKKGDSLFRSVIKHGILTSG